INMVMQSFEHPEDRSPLAKIHTHAIVGDGNNGIVRIFFSSNFNKRISILRFIFKTVCYQIGKNTPQVFGCKIDIDRKSTRLNSSHVKISYAVFCLKKKNKLDIKTKIC